MSEKSEESGYPVPVRVNLIAKILTSIALIAVLAPGLSIVLPTSESSPENDEIDRITRVERSLRDSLILLRNRLDQVRDQVDSFSQLSDSVLIEAELSELNSRVVRMEERQNRIESIIMDNPQKSLELPLLRNEVENIEKQQRQIISNVEDEVDRIYDLNKWLFGGTAIGVISIAISNLIMYRRE